MHILLVEDDARLVRRMVRVLREERHTVEAVTDGQTALALAESGSFDCLILDVLLPTMNGFAVCRWLREHAVTTPILLLTALGDVQDKVRGLDTGADDYLAKPFSFEELLARLRALERRKASSYQAITAYQLGSLHLNLLTRIVEVDGIKIDLSVREFALLEYFLRHPHQALTRQQILSAVWPRESEVNSSIVDTYIHYLRTKIECVSGAPQIRTKRSIGYLLTIPRQDEEEPTSRKRGNP